MINFLQRKLKTKRILILGFGREGRSSFKVLSSISPKLDLSIADYDDNIRNDELVAGLIPENLHLGIDYLKELNTYDIILKSPGVYIPEEMRTNLELSSQTELFLDFYKSQIIGVTATKGKSTTSSLIHFILQKAKRKSILIGNIGIPAFDSLANIDEETIIVFELSAHQLENLSCSPKMAILLNIFPEHLDYFKTFDSYKKAKENIYRFQTKDDVLISNAEIINHSNIESQVLSFGIDDTNNGFFTDSNLSISTSRSKFEYPRDGIKLHGDHNLLNILAASLALSWLGVGQGVINSAVQEFSGLPHRLEYVGLYNGIHFYNDSISTVPQSCIEAVRSLKIVDTIILGGFDRGVNYMELAKYLVSQDISNFIFLGKAGDVIFSLMDTLKSNNKNYYKFSDLESAFQTIIDNTKEGSICLLSPAAASYDQFKNFEHRGDKFVDLVKFGGHKKSGY